MPDKVVFLKLVERGAENPREFQLKIPIGDKAYTPTAWQSICGPANTPWKIPFDVDNPDPETTDELIGIASTTSQNIPLSYSFNDLDENFIELSASPDGQIGTDNTNVAFECKGFSGILSIRLCSFPNPLAPAGSVFNSRVSTISSTAYVNRYLWQSYRYGPSWDPNYPWGRPGSETWIRPNNDWFNHNAYTNRTLYVQDGLRPRISFHLEKFRDPRWTAGRFIDCLVINHWQWVTNPDTSEGADPYIYRVVNQQIISAKYISDDPFTPQTPLTPSKTKNSTPNGGRGNRNNFSADVPMPNARGLAAFSKYADGNASGIHLYKMNATNWALLEGELWNPDLIGKIAQLADRGINGNKNLGDFIISAVRIGLPTDVTGDTYSVTVGNINFMTASPYGLISGKVLSSRFTETQTYTIEVPYYTETFLDFDPMTKIQLHIPYCGVMSISPDACMGGKVEVKYIVDLISAECTAIVRTIDQFNNTKIAGCMSGKCGVSIPFLTNDLNQEKIAGSIGSLVTGLMAGKIGGIAKGGFGLAGTQADLMDSTKVSDSSAVGGMSAIMADRSLYLAIYHPQDLTGLDIDDRGVEQVDNLGNKIGYTAAYFSKVGEFVDDAYIEAIINPNSIQTATDAEKEAIRNQLQRGVYI